MIVKLCNISALSCFEMHNFPPLFPYFAHYPQVKSESVSHWVMSHSLQLHGLPPGSSVHGILQARILEWVAIPFSRGSSWLRDWTWVSCIAGRFFTTWASRFLWISTMKKPRKLKELIEILVKNVADNSYRGKSEWPRNRWRDIEITWNRDLRKRKMIPADYGGYRG